MEIENNVVKLFPEDGSAPQTGEQEASNREKWLSALEKESFEISDDTLEDSEMYPQPEIPRGPGDPLNPAESAGPLTADPLARGVREATARPGAAPGLPAGAPTAPIIQAPMQAQVRAAGAVPGTPQARPGAPGAGGIGPSSPGYAQRYEALMSQTRFMDVNIQLTQSATGTTLWIRDFKHQYASEVYHWARSLETLMRERGQSLSRIMLNGKPIASIEAIYGGTP